MRTLTIYQLLYQDGHNKIQMQRIRQQYTQTLARHQINEYLTLYKKCLSDEFGGDPVCKFNPTTEREFERRINEETPLNVTFEGPVSHFLGLWYDHSTDKDGNITIHMSQSATIQDLLIEARMNSYTNYKPTPYRSGHPVDSIPNEDLPLHQKQKLQKQLQNYTGSLNWLATQTRPDISAQHNSDPSHGHIDAARYVLQYLKGTSNLGISFSTAPNNMESFVKYPVDPSQLLPFTDANWGPQDQSIPKPGNPPQHLDLWKSRSISGFMIWLGGPLHWQSKRQSITARSSAEAEIYAID